MNYRDLHEAIRTGTAARVIPAWAVDFLAGVADGRTDVASTRHPLGFLCVPAWRGDGYGICVHIWSDSLPRADTTTSQIHAHSWDLVSYVLYGTVRNEVFHPVDTGTSKDKDTDPTHRVFEIHTGAGYAGLDAIRATSRLVRAGTPVAETYRHGDIYTVRSGVFHASVVAGEAATVALGEDRPGTVDLSLGGIDAADHDVRRWRCDPEETRCVAKAVTARIARGTPSGSLPSDLED